MQDPSTWSCWRPWWRAEQLDVGCCSDPQSLHEAWSPSQIQFCYLEQVVVWQEMRMKALLINFCHHQFYHHLLVVIAHRLQSGQEHNLVHIRFTSQNLSTRQAVFDTCWVQIRVYIIIGGMTTVAKDCKKSGLGVLRELTYGGVPEFLAE